MAVPKPGSSEHPNARLARQVWDGTALGDAEALVALYAPDIVWRSRGLGPIAATMRGTEAVFDYLAGVGELVDELRSELLEIFAAPTGAAIHYHTSARAGERKLESDLVMLLRIEEGRVTHVDVVPLDPRTDADFWGAVTDQG